jgi:hypothetical protein
VIQNELFQGVLGLVRIGARCMLCLFLGCEESRKTSVMTIGSPTFIVVPISNFLVFTKCMEQKFCLDRLIVTVTIGPRGKKKRILNFEWPGAKAAES